MLHNLRFFLRQYYLLLSAIFYLLSSHFLGAAPSSLLAVTVSQAGAESVSGRAEPTTIVFDVPTVPCVLAGAKILYENISRRSSYWGAAAYHLSRCGAGNLLAGGDSAQLQNQLFGLLHSIEMPQEIREKNQVEAVFQGAKVPAVLSAYLKGDELPGGTLSGVYAHIDQARDLNESYKAVYKGIAELIFTPEQLGQSVAADPKFLVMLSNIKKYRPHTQFLLASSLVLDELKKQESFRPLFALSDNIITVARLKELRPDSAFYRALAREFSLNQHSTVIIENEPQYIAGAHAAGFKKSLCWSDRGALETILDLVKN